MEKKLIVVTGAGGFIGGHLVSRLLADPAVSVRAADIKPFSQWHQIFDAAENLQLDCSLRENCYRITQGAWQVYNLAADMGGMGFITNNKALCMLSVLINTHMVLASRENGVERYFYSSSACVYRADRQLETDITALREEDAYPAEAEDGYGWEKLFSERMCRHFREDFGLVTRVARFHNVYGPHGTWDGGREKAPAAICRKVIAAKLSGDLRIDIWGDGHQTRSFMYIDDCLRGTDLIFNSNVEEPLNLGSHEMVSINQLVDLVENIAGVRLKRSYNLNAPQGVRGRNSDNTLFRKHFCWEPSTPLAEGLERTYAWIYDQMVSGKASKD